MLMVEQEDYKGHTCTVKENGKRFSGVVRKDGRFVKEFHGAASSHRVKKSMHKFVDKKVR